MEEVLDFKLKSSENIIKKERVIFREILDNLISLRLLKDEFNIIKSEEEKKLRIFQIELINAKIDEKKNELNLIFIFGNFGILTFLSVFSSIILFFFCKFRKLSSSSYLSSIFCPKNSFSISLIFFSVSFSAISTINFFNKSKIDRKKEINKEIDDLNSEINY